MDGPTFFDPVQAARDLVEKLQPLNGSGSYPSPDWKRVLAEVERDDRQRHAERCNATIPPHVVIQADFRLNSGRPKLTVLGPGFHLVPDQTRNAIAVRAYHLRHQARIRRNMQCELSKRVLW